MENMQGVPWGELKFRYGKPLVSKKLIYKFHTYVNRRVATET